MKIYIKAIHYILFAIFISSCSDFLDEKPQSDFTQEGTGNEDQTSKYHNLADAQAELQGAYNTFKADIFQLENYTINDIQSDNCYVGGDGSNEEAVDRIKLTSTNAKVGIIWSQYYSMAGSATTVIENTKLLEVPQSQELEKRKIIAEAQFIRAWAHFDLVRLWGDIPMVLALIPTITAENLDKWYPVMYPSRTPKEEVYEQILKDLDEHESIKYLSSKSQGAFLATKGAAYGLLAKVYATKGNKSARDYNKAIEYANKCINEGYTLVDNFDDLWNPDNKFTKESIFEVYYTADAPNWAFWTLLKEEDGSVTWRRYCTPSHDLVNKFDKENDTRFTASILWKEAPYDTFWPANHYPFAYKIREKSSDIILMRIADILLLKAEALVELNQVNQAISIVNQIRKRAGIKSLNPSMTQEKARLAVENERQLELFMEGQRWYDLTRNNRLIEVMSQHKDKDGNKLISNLNENKYYWPIPQLELDKNDNLIQNKGY
ncbi:RagB/SusD domain-containing protein [Bacteroides coprosuis DSM 18011]|uniref:RagB/SusD domain-containing protein n=1 Tax=Bacteroides coprosuis DSM 18011 TaxID=679937 RepID=F3ZRS8_9BACE|nr:RagB/SusD family nutrient uptake outer membrane protein [Bacteroides coprosuis]EGJ72017.1 RagB/SusD domain-containing protein [Bacteroides coprosuis DSM 18011]